MYYRQEWVRVYKAASDIVSHFIQPTAVQYVLRVYFHFLTGIMRALPLLLTLFAGILISSVAVPEGTYMYICSRTQYIQMYP